MDGNTTAAGSHHFIGNRWVASSTGQTIDVIDPSDGKAFAKDRTRQLPTTLMQLRCWRRAVRWANSLTVIGAA